MLWTIAYYLSGPLFKIFYRFKVVGRENIPPKGPAILVSNHLSYLDPIVLGLAVKRKIYFMAKEELFRIPLFHRLIKILYAFPVKRRGFDRKALKAALEFLSQGKIVGLFPEGTRHREGTVGPFSSGVALLALKSGAPVIPLGIKGTNRVILKDKILPRFPRIEVKVGRSFIVGKENFSKEKVLLGTKKIKQSLTALLNGGKVES